ncbi:MAG: hypothetical protein Q9214_002485 [Letrouitia sp. 1 TL-2023]
MSSEKVLRVPRSDSPGDFIILHVSSHGPSPLDLKLLATEGAEPYVKILKQSRVHKYRSSSDQLDLPQWEYLLRSQLLGEPRPSTSFSDQPKFQNISLAAAINPRDLTLTIRKPISDIHQILGSLTLMKDSNLVLDIFSWCSVSLANSSTLVALVSSLEDKCKKQEAAIADLRQHVEDLAKRKEEHEDILIQKFAELLNEKKLKIREQNRLLVTAKPDPRRVTEMQRLRSQSVKHNPEESREGKRKVSDGASDAESDAFEDVKHEQVEEPAYDSEQETPQHSDLDATDDEIENDDLDSVPTVVGAKGKVLEGTKMRAASLSRSPIPPPPKRELPFNRLGANHGKVILERVGDEKMEDADGEGEGSTDDDEL